MEQLALYHEDIYEAIKTAVQALGGSKKVGSTLWPDKSPDKAGELLNNCLNTTRNEKLDPEQFIYLSNEAQKIGMHSIADFYSSACNYKFIPVKPEDEKAELMKQFNQSVSLQNQIVKRLEAMNS